MRPRSGGLDPLDLYHGIRPRADFGL